MSIDKVQLEADIAVIFNANKAETNQATAITNISKALADKIADAIKRGIDSATIALTSPSGVVTGTITATK